MSARVEIRQVRLAGFARVAGALSAPVLVLSGLANRFELMPSFAVLPALMTGFLLGLGALVMAIFALIKIWRQGGLGAGNAIAAIFYSVPALLLADLVVFAILAYPPIADITTDAANPPQFLALRGARAAAGGTGQEGPPQAIAGTAARLYPLGIDPVYSAVTTIVSGRGWQVALNRPPADAAGTAKIEATAKTLLFAFRDDVAIRLAATPDGTRVDMRSASRWGRHDLGQNGRRIRAFMTDLDLGLQGLFTEVEPPSPEQIEEAGEAASEERTIEK